MAKYKKEAKVVMKISPSETLRRIKVGETRIIKQSDIDMATVRSTSCRLSKQGYSFYTKSCPEGITVTRTR